MHNNQALAALSRMHLKPAFFAAGHEQMLVSHLQQMASADVAEQSGAWAERKNDLSMNYGQGSPRTEKPFAFAAGKAIIPIHGSLINRFSASWGFVTGYNFIRAQLDAAMADDDVDGVIYDVNSFGGHAANCMETSEYIRKASQVKPSMALVDSYAFSAAYALASAATKMYSIKSGDVGSIGVVATHVSYEKMLADVGLKITFITAGAHKVDGNPYQDLSDEAKAGMQRNIDSAYEDFVAQVALNRSLDAKTVRDTEARCYSAEDGLALGLIDGIVSQEDALAQFPGGSAGTTSMSKGTPAVAENTVDAAEIRKAERARISGILNCEEAKGREGLASHFANTEMTVEDARAALAAAPKAAEPAAAIVAPPAAAAASHFNNAMDAGGTPGVGADAGAGVVLQGPGGQQSKRNLDALHAMVSPRLANGQPNRNKSNIA